GGLLARGGHSGLLVQNPSDRGQRDLYPIGPVGHLVGELVDGLVELEGGQHGVARRRAAWDQARLDRGRDVAVKKGVPVAALPPVGLLGLVPASIALAERHLGRVVERAQYPRHVAQRGARGLTLGERASGLA